MISAVRATVILGASSIASLAIGVAAAKAYALLIGPSGVGYMGLLQSSIGLGVLWAGAGTSSGLVQRLARALGDGDLAAAAALRRAAWVLTLVLGSLTVGVLLAFAPTLSGWVTGESAPHVAAMFVAVAVVFMLAANVHLSTLNGYHRVAALAKLGVATSLLGAASGIISVTILGEDGIGLAVVSAAASAWIVALVFQRRHAPRLTESSTFADIVRAAKSLIAFAGPFTASALVGSGVMLLLPILVFTELGTASTGYYRAASAIAVGYVTFLLTALSQDFYPRLAATESDPGVLARTIDEQRRLVMLLGAPLILAALAFAPLLLPLLYSSSFVPALGLLEWQLLAVLLKLPSWVLGFSILARQSSVTYFATESFAGLAILSSSVIGLSLFGLEGMGIGYFLSYAAYLAAAWIVVRRSAPIRFGSIDGLILGSVAIGVLVPLAPYLGMPALRTPIAAGVALLVSAISVRAFVSRPNANLTATP